MNNKTAFYLCLFGGFLGLHKFYQKDYKKGFLYLFTIGIFGFGWLIDLIKLGKHIFGRSTKEALTIISIETDIEYDDMDYYDALALIITYRKTKLTEKNMFLNEVKKHCEELKQENTYKNIELEWIDEDTIEAKILYILNEE